MKKLHASQISSPRIIEQIPDSLEADAPYTKQLENPPPGWLTIEVALCGICGTDVHIYRGEYLGDYPIIPGHEFAGTIIALGEGVDTLKIGDRVAVEPNLSCGTCPACLENRQHFCENWQAIGVSLPGAMATLVSVPQQAAFDIGDLPFSRAAFMEPLSCVIHGVEKVAPSLGSRVVLIGAGPIGMLLMRVLRSAGVSRIDVIERNGNRADFAQKDGADAVFEDLTNASTGRYDLVVDATGSIPVLERCIDLVRPAGKVLFFGVPPRGEMMKIEPFKLFNNEVTIVSSFTSLRNSLQAIRMMQSGQVRVDDLISHVFSLKDLQKGLDLLSNPGEPVMKVMIDPHT